MKNAYNDLVRLDDSLSKLPKESKQFRETLFDANDLSRIVMLLPVDVGTAAVKASTAAIKFGDESERRLERYDTATFWISCALYVVGWGIALMSKIDGPDDDSVE